MQKMIFIILSICLLTTFLQSKNLLDNDSHAIDSSKEAIVKGQIITQGKKPIYRANIKLGSLQTKSNKKGYFQFKSVRYGKYDLIIEHSDYHEKTININVHSDIVTLEKITLERINTKGILTGKVTDIKGKPIQYANIFLKGHEIGTQTNKKGKFELKVKAGTYKVICSLMGYGKRRVNNVKIKPDKTYSLNFKMKKVKVDMSMFKVESPEGETIKKTKPSSGRKNLVEYKESSTDEDKEVEESFDYTTEDEPATKPEKEIGGSEMATESRPKSAGASEFKKKYRKPTKSGLKASYVDDNEQFNRYLQFLDKYNYAKHFELNVSERFIINIKDKLKRALPGIDVEIFDMDGQMVENGKTYADGSYLFFPKLYSDQTKKYLLKAYYDNAQEEIQIDYQNPRKTDLIFLGKTRNLPQNIPLDILFIFDTTGSMGEEINRLKATIELIKMNIAAFKPIPEVHFGMVLYRDKGDVYRTKEVPFTADMDEFILTLKKLKVAGGGDKPEDMQSALKAAMQKMQWRENAVKLGFIVTDAPPHLNYNQKYTYIKAAKDAKKNGIKLFSIGTGGLDINGEYVLRQISQFTSANYVFLTYGEKGESEGGRPGSVSHHTGENFQTDKLESIVIQLVKRELKHYANREIEKGEDYFVANPIDNEGDKETLQKLFNRGISQLSDYSTIKLEKHTPVAIAPIITTTNGQKLNAEYFYENFVMTLSGNDQFKAVVRKDLQPVFDELEFQLEALANQENAAELGKFMNADLIIIAKMYEKNGYYELFLKLMNVETIEILSVTKLRINKKLGL